MRTLIDTCIAAVFVVFLSIIAGNALAEERAAGAELFVTNSQLKTLPLRIFVTHDISEAMSPHLTLVASHSVITPDPKEAAPIAPKMVARWQRSKQSFQGEEINLTGTLLLFDLSDYPIPFYKGMVRLVPVLVWTEEENGKAVKHTLIGPERINLGNVFPVIFWSLSIVGALVTAIAVVASRTGRSPAFLLCNPAGRLSLANTQVALWTIGIGFVVAGYGFLRLEMPDIPETLVALMGLSFAVGGASHYRSKGSPRKGDLPPRDAKLYRQRPRLFHLVSEVQPDGEELLSLPRAQMVFWTGITLTLFIVKSMLDGVLWNVPWEMVAFMGMSQLGYLGHKWMPPKASGENPEGEGAQMPKQKDETKEGDRAKI